jgi:hypothetical protein
VTKNERRGAPLLSELRVNLCAAGRLRCEGGTRQRTAGVTSEDGPERSVDGKNLSLEWHLRYLERVGGLA